MIKLTNAEFESLVKSKYYDNKDFQEKVYNILHDNEYTLKQPYIEKIKGIIYLSKKQEANLAMNYNFVGNEQMPLITPKVKLEDVFLEDSTRDKVEQLIKAYNHRDLLANYNLPYPRNLIFEGQSGMGKSMLAEALANELELPFFKINVSSLIDSKIGSTAQNLQTIYQRIQHNQGLYLFDEFDSIATARSSSINESANKEFNSVLTELLKDMEQPYTAGSIAIYTTNKPELLDSALERRFDFKLHFDNFIDNGKDRQRMIYSLYTKKYAKQHNADISIFQSYWQNNDDITFSNYAELKKLCDSILTNYLLAEI